MGTVSATKSINMYFRKAEGCSRIILFKDMEDLIQSSTLDAGALAPVTSSIMSLFPLA